MTGVFAGQWGVVSGGSKGIGFGIAEALHGSGMNVVLVARQESDLIEAEKALNTRPDAGPDAARVVTVVADMSDPTGLAAVFSRLENEIPRLNVYVACAGTQRLAPLLEVTEEQWDTIVSLNLKGTFFGCQAAARRMVSEEQHNKSIIVVSSNRARTIRPGSLVYSMTKAALNRFVRGAAAELAEFDIRVNSLSPGVTKTPLADTPALQEAFHRAIGRIPLGRAASIQDCGAAAVYLAQPASSFVTGTDLVVDGGESLW
jgi:3-oxoacyl-[acyl-carrier protein] reductase